MLKEILNLLKEEEVASVGWIAQKLNVPYEFVPALIADLCRRGYLKEMLPRTPCFGGCPGCVGVKANTKISGIPRTWELTEKGRRKKIVS